MTYHLSSVSFAFLNGLISSVLYLLVIWSLVATAALKSYEMLFMLLFIDIQCVLVWSVTNISDCTAPSCLWKLIQLQAEGKGSRHSPQRAVTLPRAALILVFILFFFFSPFAFDEKTYQRCFGGLVETDSVGFMFSRSFCLNCGRLKSQVWTRRHRHQAPRQLLAAESRPTPIRHLSRRHRITRRNNGTSICGQESVPV